MRRRRAGAADSLVFNLSIGILRSGPGQGWSGGDFSGSYNSLSVPDARETSAKTAHFFNRLPQARARG